MPWASMGRMLRIYDMTFARQPLKGARDLQKVLDLLRTLVAATKSISVQWGEDAIIN